MSEFFVDAFDDEEVAPAAVDEHLREVVPVPAAADTEKLEEESTHHRTLLVRGGAVIAVTTLVAVGGALLIHAIFGGLIVLGTLFPWSRGAIASGGGASPTLRDEGANSFSMLGDGPDANAAPSPDPIFKPGAPDAGMPAPPSLETLAPLPETSTRNAAAQLVQPSAPDLPAANLGTVRVAQPKPSVGSPSITPAPSGVQGTTAGISGQPARGNDTGNGGGSDDEPVINWVKGSGTGSGRGSGAGNGIDRGFSAADRSPQIIGYALPDSRFTLPLKYQIRPPEKAVKFNLTIGPDGAITAVHLEQSCGIADVDELAKAYVLNLRFSPGYKAGKAITADFPYGIDFQPLQ
ncbi:MAG TPA: hypothetical protein VHM90_05225 [Phycisphaerae bacterium]|nr:hypothetical protein [Phycisphaerae bacterium]